MEILSYLNLTFRRVVTLLLLGGLASVVVVSLIRRQPDTYEARSTVFISQVFPGSTQELGNVIADFRTIMKLPAVTGATAEATGAPRASLKDLKTSVGFNSALVTVTYHSADPNVARAVVDFAPREAMRFQLRSTIEPAQQAFQQVTDEYEESLRRLNAFVQDVIRGAPGIRGTDLLAELDQLSAQVFQLDLLKAGAVGSPNADALIARYDALVTSIENKANVIQVNRDGYQQLRDRVELARSQRNSARADLLQATARQAIIETPTVVAVETPYVVSKLPAVVRGLIAAFVTVFALGLVLFAILDGRRRDEEFYDEDFDDGWDDLEREPVTTSEPPSREPASRSLVPRSATAVRRQTEMTFGPKTVDEPEDEPVAEAARPEATAVDLTVPATPDDAASDDEAPEAVEAWIPRRYGRKG